jgi:MFS family permease
MSNGNDDSLAPNAHRLLWAGFMAILAAGVGFSVRGGILTQWASKFGFTMTELGTITGGGLTGGGVIILAGAFIADKVGYGKLMALAFVTHFVSAVLTLAAGPVYTSWGKPWAFQCLFWGMFLFAVGNGICEAVVNPLVATLFPKNKSHYLNILHAGWPGGLIIGGLISYFMNPDGQEAVAWQIQMTLFLIPVVLYGAMLLGQRFPKSEASAAGVHYGEMIIQLFAPLMILLLVLHAMVGYVELGTDSWIAKITGTILESPQAGLLLLVYTSGLMFALRFFAGPIVHRISPLGLLCVSGVLGFVGLQLMANATSVALCILAATVYSCGKTFLWPTMLAVASEQFPKGGAITIGAIGGMGMLSAGLLGGPGIGFKQDYFATSQLKEKSPEVYSRYQAEEKNTFLGYEVVGLDGAKRGVLDDGGKELAREGEILAAEGKNKDAKEVQNHEKMAAWWADASKHAHTQSELKLIKEKKLAEDPAKDNRSVREAVLRGGRMALVITSYVPAAMAVVYLLMILGFKARGGYKAIHIENPEMLGTAES